MIIGLIPGRVTCKTCCHLEAPSTIAKHIQQHILEHLHEDLSLIKLAEMVFLHPNYLSRLFKRTLNVTLSEYVNEARMTLAKQLLKTSNMKIYEIAAPTGHESAAYFTRSFKKHTNLTPQEYRESIK